MELFIKPFRNGWFGSVRCGELFEKRLRRRVRRGDRGLYIIDFPAFGALQQCVEHPACQALATSTLCHYDLPDEQGVGAGWYEVAGNKPDQLAIQFCANRCAVKMRALKQVAIDGVRVQWWT